LQPLKSECTSSDAQPPAEKALKECRSVAASSPHLHREKEGIHRKFALILTQMDDYHSETYHILFG
jgi:hypothetical protein